MIRGRGRGGRGGQRGAFKRSYDDSRDHSGFRGGRGRGGPNFRGNRGAGGRGGSRGRFPRGGKAPAPRPEKPSNTTLDVSGRELTSLDDVEAPETTTKLVLDNNQLTSLKVRGSGGRFLKS